MLAEISGRADLDKKYVVAVVGLYIDADLQLDEETSAKLTKAATALDLGEVQRAAFAKRFGAELARRSGTSQEVRAHGTLAY